MKKPSICLMASAAALFTFSAVTLAADWDRFGWEGVRNAANTSVPSLCVFNNSLYIGTGKAAAAAEVWQYNSGGWTNVSPGWGVANIAAVSMAVYDSELFVGTQNAFGAEVWSRTTGGAWTWEAPGWAAGNTSARSMCVFDGYLYVGTENPTTGCELWRFDGASWDEVDIGNSFGDTDNTAIASMITYADSLMVGTRNAFDGAELWEISDGLFPDLDDRTGDWDDENIEVSSLGEVDSYLEIGTECLTADGGAEIWETDDSFSFSEWRVTGGFANADNDRMSAMVKGGTRLYVGTRNDDNSEACELFRTSSGLSWYREDDAGLDNDDNTDIRSFAVFDDEVYCGVSNPNGSELYRTDVVTSSWWSNAGGGGGGCFLGVSAASAPSPGVPCALIAVCLISLCGLLAARTMTNWRKKACA